MTDFFNPRMREPGDDDEELILWQEEPFLDIAQDVKDRIKAITQLVKEQRMNVAQQIEASGSGERPDLLSAADVKRNPSAKIIGVSKIITTKDFNGLALTLKHANGKRGYLLAFNRFDLGSVSAQCNSSETDDWIGETIRFVNKKSKDGKRTFVNVVNPGPGKKKSRKSSRKGKR